MSSRGTDFFISHAGRDTAWAEWLAWQLQQAGYTVELDVWDVTIQGVAGIQTFPLVSSVRTSNGRRPCLAAVDR